MEDKICGIYKITNMINGKSYIGQSIDIYKRWYQHKREVIDKRYNSILYLAMRKYGIDNFNFSIVQECTKDELNDLERYYIKAYNSYIGFKNSHGYNMTLGGEGLSGYSQSYGHIEKRVSQFRGKPSWNKGKHYHTNIHLCGELNPFYGHNLSEDAKKKISEARKGKPVKTICKKVICDGIIYSSITECAKYYNVSVGNMSAWISGTRGMPENFYNIGLNTIPANPKIYKACRAKGSKSGTARKIICLTTNKIFDTIKEAGEYYATNISSIIAVCKGKRKTAGKLFNGSKLCWAYYEDYLKGGEN